MIWQEKISTTWWK